MRATPLPGNIGETEPTEFGGAVWRDGFYSPPPNLTGAAAAVVAIRIQVNQPGSCGTAGAAAWHLHFSAKHDAVADRNQDADDSLVFSEFLV